VQPHLYGAWVIYEATIEPGSPESQTQVPWSQSLGPAWLQGLLNQIQRTGQPPGETGGG
jgi:hypothetical protein